MSEPESITCPECGMTSYNPSDVREGYCGNCHDWTRGYGTREITPRDRKTAIVRELINSEPVLHITPGMWRGLQRGKRRSWWRRAVEWVRDSATQETDG